MVIEVQNMHKSYGGTVAVDDVSFTVQEGEIFGIPGPGGAGTTATVECIQGPGTPGSGTVSVLGLDPAGDRGKPRRRLGARLQDSRLPGRLRVGEALKLYSSSPPGPPIAPSPGRIGPGSIHRTGPYQQDPFLSGSRCIPDL